MDTITVIDEITKIAKKNQLRESTQKTRDVSKDIACFRQGDLYIFRVSPDHPTGDIITRSNGQIINGQSLGARHILTGGTFTVYEGVKPPDVIRSPHSNICLGYAFDVSHGSTLTHPEHDHFYFTYGGRFQVMHQIDLRTLQKARD